MGKKERSILWKGTSSILLPPVFSSETVPDYTLPLVEETVLTTAFDTNDGSLHLSKTASVNCTSRLAQRVALSQTGLNPTWRCFEWCSGVIKAPASCQNNGVHFCKETEHTELLRQYAPELSSKGVIEEYVVGEAYEVDGCVFSSSITLFHTLIQTWNAEHTAIQEYKRSDTPPGLHEAIFKAVVAVGLNNSCFCVELRLLPTHEWRVIEIHARLGEDKGLCELLCDADVFQTVQRACAA